MCVCVCVCVCARVCVCVSHQLVVTCGLCVGPTAGGVRFMDECVQVCVGVSLCVFTNALLAESLNVVFLSSRTFSSVYLASAFTPSLNSPCTQLLVVWSMSVFSLPIFALSDSGAGFTPGGATLRHKIFRWRCGTSGSRVGDQRAWHPLDRDVRG